MDALHVWTIGHSTRSGEEFVQALAAWGIETVADVRRFPGSRKHPQFGQGALRDLLQAHGIAYTWIERLGGRRRLQPDLPVPAGWRNPSFQAYAQYMQTEPFADGVSELLNLAAASRTTLMCSELLWWRCHRALVSTALTQGGVQVTHILDAAQAVPHPGGWAANLV
jgi:uncharacterized protein (DUF488 family)